MAKILGLVPVLGPSRSDSGRSRCRRGLSLAGGRPTLRRCLSDRLCADPRPSRPHPEPGCVGVVVPPARAIAYRAPSKSGAGPSFARSPTFFAPEAKTVPIGEQSGMPRLLLQCMVQNTGSQCTDCSSAARPSAVSDQNKLQITPSAGSLSTF